MPGYLDQRKINDQIRKEGYVPFDTSVILEPWNPSGDLWNGDIYTTPAAQEVLAKGNALSSGNIGQDINDFLNSAAEATTGLDFGDSYERTVNPNGPWSSSSSGSGIGSTAAAAKPSNDMQAYVDMINSITAKNNQWAADQAQKQMDFQERMARNAHQYEMEDLKKAGLNPVLTAMGGNGASSASGAMAQPDTTNSQFLSQMALQAVDSLGNSAVNLAAASGRKSANNFTDKLLNAAGKYVIPTLVRSITKGIFG